MTALVDEHPHLGVECVLRELSIASSTYYRWRRAEREPCERVRRDAELTEQIKEIHADSGGIYGSPRVHAILKREGVHVGRKRVERLMREADIAGISPRRKGFTRRDPKASLAPDLVQRDFTASAPNRLWVTDLTMIATDEGPLWLSAIRDAFSRRVVAWETSARADADLVLSTLEYALASREVEPGQLIHHADHGCQYTSIKLTTRLLRAGVQASMGSVGDSYDNALAENLWMITKTECIRGRVFATRAEANLALFEYIDGFYNSRRIQKRLGYLSPIEFEEKHYADRATTERTNLKPRQPALTSRSVPPARRGNLIPPACQTAAPSLAHARIQPCPTARRPRSTLPWQRTVSPARRMDPHGCCHLRRQLPTTVQLREDSPTAAPLFASELG
ncbi:IS3 family transposase [Streptomyces althioticus]|uniref:IS3 family transposase n=1 Tax=Streptomyces althioticus TaxID=83380 RepID=UPI003679D284